MTPAIVLTMLLALPPAHEDRNEPNRVERLSVIADAVAQSVDRATCEGYSPCTPIWTGAPRDLAALVVTVGWWESRFARNVHAGKCRPYQCDAVRMPGGYVVHRARSPWQLQRTSWAESVWTKLEGVELVETRNAAWTATRILAEGSRRCQSVSGTVGWYACGRCSWSGGPRRAATVRKLVSLDGAKSSEGLDDDGPKRRRDERDPRR
jgi:hypothetical protein